MKVKHPTYVDDIMTTFNIMSLSTYGIFRPIHNQCSSVLVDVSTQHIMDSMKSTLVEKESKGSSEKHNRSISTGNRAQRDSNTQFSNYRNQ